MGTKTILAVPFLCGLVVLVYNIAYTSVRVSPRLSPHLLSRFPSEDGDPTRQGRDKAELPRCSDNRTHLLGRQPVYTSATDIKEKIVVLGGKWKPADCVPDQRVAIIIPYRDRPEHLRVLLTQLHPLLQRQKQHYTIFVIEQNGTYLFNRAKLFNIGVKLAEVAFKPDCVIFHDVDLIPEDDRNLYECWDRGPKHMSVAIDEHNYELRYEQLAGGVLAIKVETLYQLNGYSNLYYGWGCEDDDFYWRMFHHKINITRPSGEIARYTMIKHDKRVHEKLYNDRRSHYHIQKDKDMSRFDGLSTLDIKIISSSDHDLYTHVLVDVGKPTAADVHAAFENIEKQQVTPS